jgi:hypothetical protein
MLVESSPKLWQPTSENSLSNFSVPEPIRANVLVLAR